MNYLWIKSKEGDAVEDCGIAYASSEQEVYDNLYHKFGYNQYSECIQVFNLNDITADVSNDLYRARSIHTEIFQ